MHPHRQIIQIAITFLLAALALGGCTPVHRATPSPPVARTLDFPLELEGRDMRMRFDFDAHPSVATTRQLDPDQLCYLSIGDGIILCSADGSYLLFGAQDGLQLLDDNPLWRLQPMRKGTHARAMLHTYATIFALAGSLDKLPDTLADYLDDPGPHPREAQALARMLLDPRGVAFPAVGHGGTFGVTVALTADGRDKIFDALQDVEDRQDTFMVSQ